MTYSEEESYAFSACITSEVAFIGVADGQCLFEDAEYGKGFVLASGTPDEINERIVLWLDKKERAQ